MPVNGPLQRITPDPGLMAAGTWGTQPSGPLVGVPRRPPFMRPTPNMGRVTTLGQPMGDARPQGDPHPLGFLPKPSTVDYAHKFTSTTLLLAGVVGLILFGPKRPRTILRRLGSKHVLPFGG